MKIQKKNWGGGGRGPVWGVRVNVIEELKSFLGKFTRKKFRGGGSVWGGGGGVRVDVNEELKFLCKFKKNVFFFLFFFFFWGGGVPGGGGGVRFGESGWM